MRKAQNIVVRVVHIIVGHSHKGMSRRHRRFRHAIGVSVGIGMMLTGVHISANGTSLFIFNQITAETLGGFLHAMGCIPIFTNIEPLYKAWTE